MNREIMIAAVSAAISAVLTFALTVGVGLSTDVIKKTITESQLSELSRRIVDEQRYRKVLLEHMRDSGDFRGNTGPEGPTGDVGPPGPNRALVCETTPRVVGRIATCPDGYVVTGCSAGGNRGSIRHEPTRCVTDNLDTDWTEARCCSLN